jgi:protein FAM50
MPDFSANFHRPDTGIHTVEGNVAGSRAATLTRKREADQEAFEQRKKKIVADAERGKRGIGDKFDGTSKLSKSEAEFRSKTVGLVTAEEFRRATREAEELKKKKVVGLFDEVEEEADGKLSAGAAAASASAAAGESSDAERKALEKQRKKERKKALKKKKKAMSTLSFAGAEDADGIVDDGADDAAAGGSSDEQGREVKKNPAVDTSFLPDRDREAAAEAERLRLKREWVQKQKAMQNEMLDITYSYWDGSGHRRNVRCKKGDTIGDFLDLVRKDLSKEFREIANVSSDALLYVKEDLIIPHDISFYDLIATKARGKSGPLFNFGVHDDIRVGAIDVRVEKDESHPGKVVERKWFERNKHIFPASRWEVFDPAKDYGTYTIHGGEVNTKKK